jgi:polysaccharide biosynthesis protein VpsQ
MKLLAILFSIFILVVIVLADEGRLGPVSRLYDFPYGDKAAHFILFGLLALVLNLYALPRYPASPKQAVWAIGLALALLIGIEELSQATFPTRTVDAIDLLASYAGVLIFSAIAYFWNKRSLTALRSAS